MQLLLYGTEGLSYDVNKLALTLMIACIFKTESLDGKSFLLAQSPRRYPTSFHSLSACERFYFCQSSFLVDCSKDSGTMVKENRCRFDQILDSRKRSNSLRFGPVRFRG